MTIATANRSRLFVNTPIAGIGIICLRQSAAKYGAEVYAFCFMSDHLHILARTPEGTDFSEFIRIFKQISSHRLRRVLNGNHIWQPSYFDHALRSSEDLEAVAKYIFNNPVRAGVVESAAQYPFSGSLVWDVPSKGPIGPVLREDIRGPAKNVTRHLQVPSAPRYREKRP